MPRVGEDLENLSGMLGSYEDRENEGAAVRACKEPINGDRVFRD